MKDDQLVEQAVEVCDVQGICYSKDPKKLLEKLIELEREREE